MGKFYHDSGGLCLQKNGGCPYFLDSPLEFMNRSKRFLLFVILLAKPIWFNTPELAAAEIGNIMKG
jgi:hypothetical protein